MKRLPELLLSAVLLAAQLSHVLSQGFFFPEESPPDQIQPRSSYNARGWQRQPQPPPVRAPSKVFRSGSSKVNFPGTPAASSRYRGGCDDIPPAPMSSVIKCSSFSGCRAKCMTGHRFPNGEPEIRIRCEQGVWTPPEPYSDIPDCAPVCDPPCVNGGSCVGPNMCQCPAGFDGAQCEIRQEVCTAPRPTIYNARIRCSSTRCTVSCMRGFETASQRTSFDIVCSEQLGWTLEGDSTAEIPACQPICRPKCQNGGKCVALNLCQCPKQFRGPACQWPVENCNPTTKLNFNGAYNCSGRGDQFGCRLFCPEGLTFSSPPAELYSCDYATGEYSPQPIPECVAEYEVLPPTAAEFEIPRVSPEPRQCTLWSGKHVKTFDGRVYSFTGGCGFTAVRDSVNSLFRVLVKRSCERSDCSWALALTVDRTVLSVSEDRDGSPRVDVERSIGSSVGRLQLPAEVDGIVLEKEANDAVVLRINSVGLTLHYYKDMLTVFAEPALWATVSGLCGSLDGIPQNDILPTGVRATLQEHAIDEFCDDPVNTDLQCDPATLQRARSVCATTLKNADVFLPCQQAVNVEQFMTACASEFCYTLSQHLAGGVPGYSDPRAENAAAAAVCATYAAFAEECQRKTSLTITWRSEDFCPLSCPAGQVFRRCGVTPSGRCGTPLSESWVCEPGCACPEGLLLDGDQCVQSTECSCMHNGIRHEAGAQVDQDCNTCTCISGQWSCTDLACPSQCVVAGDPHYLTFDGVRYDYQGKCSYYLVQAEGYSVQAENVPCSGAISEKMNYHPASLSSEPSCTKSVRVEYHGITVDLKQDMVVLVNGETPPLVPWWVDGVYIKYASSLYLSVTLPNGLEVWWDGETRAVVHAPSALSGTLRGLCGNNNNNQRDDFATPEGDIETTAIEFAAKWKVDETCNDRTEATSHPCEVNPEKYPEAAKQCDVLISSPVFQQCHSVVDPAPYVRNCQYDLCSCRTELRDCFCVHLADYADACAARDVQLAWRAEVGMCGMNCPFGQQYKVCGDSCAHTCFDLATNTECASRCVEGCQCPDGMTLDTDGRCAPVSTCPCVYENKEYRAGHRRYQGKGSTLQLCECVNARWQCELAKGEKVALNPADKCDASKHLVFIDCQPPHPLTCKNRGRSRPEQHKSMPYACEPGCVCDEGYVLDTDSGTCVTAEQCPCHHGGVAYAHGRNISTECRQCRCESGMWTCEEEACDGVCTAWGNSHYETFDGKIFDIEGDCQYMLAKGKLSYKDQFEIIVTNVPCGAGSTCPKAVQVSVGQDAKKETVILENEKSLPSTFGMTRLSTRQAGAFAFVESPSLGLVVQWDYGTRIYIRLSPQWKGKTKGLCGNFDDNPGDDFRGPSGLLENTAIQFAEQYKLHNYCPDTRQTENACELHPERRLFAVKRCSALKSELFAACHAELDVSPFLERCIQDTCACTGGGDCECLCTAVATYGQACSRRGIHVRWRSNDLCPMQCDTECSVYSPCVSACPPKTCENRYVYEDITGMCNDDTCVEGCQPRPCPAGEVFANNTLKGCVKEKDCKTKCAVIDGRQVYEGEVVSRDECHVCYCTRGNKKCRGEPCPTEVSTPPTPTQEPPPPAPRPADLQICKSGWSGWVNRNRPVVLTRPRDVERIPAFIEPPDNQDALITIVDLVPGASDQVKGRVTFIQKTAEDPLVISGEISGLSPGQHGFHIHEQGRTGDQCKEAGGHFNPFGATHGSRSSRLRHVGDLGNIQADSTGMALVDITIPADKISLFGDHNIVGLALVVHAGADDLGRGGNAGSRATGNAGGRLACGVIRRAYDASTGPAFCADNQVTNVRCRTAGTHLTLADTGDRASCTVEQGLLCEHDHVCNDYEIQVFCDCTIQPTEVPPTVPPPPTRPPADCSKDTWTPWMSAHTPGPGDWIDYEDVRSLRAEYTFCEEEFITAIECRTKDGRRDVTTAGGGAICNLNNGLTCSDAFGYCEDFEVRFFCDCEEAATPPPVVDTDRCLRPNALLPHETDCHKYYICGGDGRKMERSCGTFMMFNPSTEVCDFEDAVLEERPECGPLPVTTTPGPALHCDEINPLREHPTDCHQYYQCVRTADDELNEYLRSCGPYMMYNPNTMTCDSIAAVRAIRPECEEVTTAIPPVVTTVPTRIDTTCPVGKVYDDCKIRCDQLCHYYSGFLESRGFCKVKDACRPGCKEEGLGYRGCPPGFMWADDDRCVQISDCNCRLPNGRPLGPGQVIVEEDGCTRAQCVDNEVVYDSSECRQITTPATVDDCDMWGDWIDNATPGVGMVEAEPWPWWSTFCENGHKSKIECQMSDTGAPYNTSGDIGVICDLNGGLVCTNHLQPSGLCHNYRVRFYCSCGPAPTVPSLISTTPETTETTTTEVPPTYPTVEPPPEECDIKRFIPLVYGDDPLPVSSITASSAAGPRAQPSNARILGQFEDAARAWMPAADDQEQYLQIDLGELQPVYAVKLLGNPSLKAAVGDFELWFSEGGEKFLPLTNKQGRPQPLTSISPLGEARPVILPTPVTARLVRIVPRTWQNRIAVKLEVYGCSKTTEPPTTTPPPVIRSTVAPPPHCDPEQYIPLLTGDQAVKNAKLTASSAVSPEMSPAAAKIRGKPEDALRSWVAKRSDINQYLQVDLGSVQPVYAVLVRGNKAVSSAVTEFEVLYSSDGNIYSYATDAMGQPAVLRAEEPLGQEPGIISLPVAIEARYVRLHPTEWQTRIAMKTELYGCSRATTPPPTEPPTTTEEPRCLQEMGLENGLLHDSLITVSSELTPEHGASAARPGQRGWVPRDSNNKQFIRVDFTDERTLDGIVTSGVTVPGEPDQTRYIGSYRVRYSQDGINWIWVYNKSGRIKVFPGHSERTALSPMQNIFEQPLHAQFLEIMPETWSEDGIGATVEVLGCYHPYPEVTTTTVAPQPVVAECSLCDGVPETEVDGCEACDPAEVWNGTACLQGTALCPCFYNGRPYEVSSIFDLADCQECICQLGGVRNCKRKTCPPCGGDLVSHLSDTCDCQCNPCEEGTRICPTSRTCLEEEKWCDGVKQCPDDEGDECREPEPTTTEPAPTEPPPTEPPLQPQYCTLKGNTFNTFDGVEYKYQICHHTLAKHEGIWEVTVHRVCDGGTCRREVRISSLGEEITLLPGVGVEYGGFRYDERQAAALRSAHHPGAFVISTVPGATILFNAPQVGFAVLVNKIGNVVVGTNSKHFEHLEGLCGNFDGHKHNDKHTPSGDLASSTAEFGDSWAIPGEEQTCEQETCQHPKEAFSICQKIRQEPFSRCHAAVLPDSFISSCLETTCECLDGGGDPDQCRCTALTSYVTECLSLDPSVELSAWRTKHHCPADCADGEVYRDCYRPSCEPSCERLEPCGILPDFCFSGCYCPDGQVRKNAECVDPIECRDCSCAVHPGGDFETFDKQEVFFNTNCTYLAAGRTEHDGKYNFKVLVDNGNCKTSYGRGVTCSDEVKVVWDDHVVLLKRTGTLVEVFVNGAMVEGFFHEYGWGSVSQPPRGSVVIAVPALHLEVSLHPASGELSVQLPSKLHGGSLGGVCGNCDSHREDEADQSPSYWLLSDQDPESCVSEQVVCEPPAEQDDPCQTMLDEAVFGQCHPLVDPAPAVAACQRRFCDDSAHGVCEDLEQYARRCYEAGICVRWRDGQQCPPRRESCPPTMVYRQCSGTCLKSCDKRDCGRLEMDGCFCPEGQVFEDNVCVDEVQCKFCDEEGHRPGDKWRPDNCTTCVCMPSGSSQCTSVECPPQPQLDCGLYDTAVEVPGTATECCPARLECQRLPIVSTTPSTTTTTTTESYCPVPVVPACDPAEGKKIQYITVNGCPVAVCECVPADECPPQEELRDLKPGESYQDRADTCCPLREIVCDAGACPAPPACPPDFLLQTAPETAADCCPQQYCRQPADTCLVRLDVAIDIRTITADDLEGFVVKRAGEVWTDGFCDNCTCREVPGGDPLYQPVCVRIACPLPSEADQEEYVYEEDLDSDDPCCPTMVRTACRDNGKVYQPDETWTPSIGGRPVDPCVTWECVRDEKHGVLKVPTREKCVEDCQLGHTYVPSQSAEQCCGTCERTSCVAGGQVHQEGERWKAADGCTEFQCERDFFDGQLTVLSMAPLCRDVSDCPPENLYTDETGCCQRCNRTDNCHVKVVPPEETVRMFKYDDCVNLEPVKGVIRCQGACDSMAFFDTDSGQIESGCKCCGVTDTKQMDVQLSCETGGGGYDSGFIHTFTVPDGCACSKCDSSSTSLGGSAGAFWQQSTGEDWEQQFVDDGFGGGGAFPSWDSLGGGGNGDGEAELIDTSRAGRRQSAIGDADFVDLLTDSAGFGPEGDLDIGQGEIH